MIFFKRRKHKLPKFPPMAAQTFRELCVDLDADELAELKTVINDTFSTQIAVDGPESNYNDYEAKEVLSACNHLFSIYDERTAIEQKLINGALRYAASVDDPFCDSTFASGMTDDKQIINYVMEEIGVDGHYLDLY